MNFELHHELIQAAVCSANVGKSYEAVAPLLEPAAQRALVLSTLSLLVL